MLPAPFPCTQPPGELHTHTGLTAAAAVPLAPPIQPFINRSSILLAPCLEAALRKEYNLISLPPNQTAAVCHLCAWVCACRCTADDATIHRHLAPEELRSLAAQALVSAAHSFSLAAATEYRLKAGPPEVCVGVGGCESVNGRGCSRASVVAHRSDLSGCTDHPGVTASANRPSTAPTLTALRL